MLEKARQLWSKVRAWSATVTGASDASSRKPIDAKGTYHAAPGVTWTYYHRRICLNEMPIDAMLQLWRLGDEWAGAAVVAGAEPTPDLPQWCAVEQGLAEYRDWLLARRWYKAAEVATAVAGLHAGILRTLHAHYTERATGVAVSHDAQGEWYVNQLPLRALLTMFVRQPNPKARRFLRGVADRLRLILRARQSNQGTATHGGLESLYHELCSLLANPDRSGTPLLAAGRH